MAKHVTELPTSETAILQLGAANTACPGRMYRSTDTTPNKLWVGAEDGSLLGPLVIGDALIIKGAYPNPDAAGTGGVAIDEYYSLTPGNDLGLPPGLVIKRTA